MTFENRSLIGSVMMGQPAWRPLSATRAATALIKRRLYA
jgi:hypothetical protein